MPHVLLPFSHFFFFINTDGHGNKAIICIFSYYTFDSAPTIDHATILKKHHVIFYTFQNYFSKRVMSRVKFFRCLVINIII